MVTQEVTYYPDSFNIKEYKEYHNGELNVHSKYDERNNKVYLYLAYENLQWERRFTPDSSKYFTYGYQKRPDLENKTIFFTKNTWSDAHQIWKRDYGTNDWGGELGYKKCREIEEELLNQENSPYIKAVKFELIEL